MIVQELYHLPLCVSVLSDTCGEFPETACKCLDGPGTVAKKYNLYKSIINDIIKLRTRLEKDGKTNNFPIRH